MRICEPVALKIAAQGSRLEVEWSDGPVTSFEGARLRALCPCDECKRGAPREGLGIADVEPLGGGALRVGFADRHRTVFTLVALRELAAVPVPSIDSDPFTLSEGTRSGSRSEHERGPESKGPLPPPPTGWVLEGNALRKTFTFASFPRAVAFLVEVACKAEAANHHPDVDVRYNRLTFSLTTHDAGGVTERDLRLAEEIEGIAP